MEEIVKTFSKIFFEWDDIIIEGLSNIIPIFKVTDKTKLILQLILKILSIAWYFYLAIYKDAKEISTNIYVKIGIAFISMLPILYDIFKQPENNENKKKKKKKKINNLKIDNNTSNINKLKDYIDDDTLKNMNHFKLNTGKIKNKIFFKKK